MSVRLDAATLLGLPSTGRFIRRVREQLHEDMHVLVVLGGSLPEALRAELAAACVESSLFQEIVSSERFPLEPVHDFLARALHRSSHLFMPGSANSPEPTDDLPNVLWVQGLEQESPERRQEWVAFAQQVAKLGWSARTRLFIPVAATEAGSDARITVVHYWSELSVLEIGLLIREAAGTEIGLSSRWRESVLPELVGTDVSLLAPLWNEVLGSSDEVTQALQREARQRQWPASLARDVQEVRRTGRGPPTATCPPAWRRLWAAGAACGTREEGGMVSSTALAWSGDDESRRELLHRLWRGQARLALPLLDEVRLRVCRVLTERHGPDWPTRFHAFLSADQESRAREDPLTVEYGPLSLITREREARADQFRDLVTRGRNLRNELAHCRPILFSQFREFVDAGRTV